MNFSTLHFCTSDSWGGLELYACTLMNELHRGGCRVTAVCKKDSKVEQYLQSQGIQCFSLPSYMPVSFSSIRFLHSLIRENTIDIFHVHFHKDIWHASLALRGGYRQTLFFSVYMGVASKDDFWHRYIFNRVDKFLTSSKQWMKHLPEVYAVPEEKIGYLPYGRSLETYAVDPSQRSALRRQYRVTDDECLVGVMARIDPAKGIADFVESFTYLESEVSGNVKYLVIGEPTRKRRTAAGETPYEEHCEEYFSAIKRFVAEHKLEDKILFAGFQDDVVGYLSALDIFVHASRNELFSLVILDAMGMSLPIAASREGGNLEQIQDGVNGLIFNAADPKDMAAKISSYYKSPDLRRRCGRSARAFVEEHHSMNVTCAMLLEQYKNTLHQQ